MNWPEHVTNIEQGKSPAQEWNRAVWWLERAVQRPNGLSQEQSQHGLRQPP
jgi:hypothetical protein